VLRLLIRTVGMRHHVLAVHAQSEARRRTRVLLVEHSVKPLVNEVVLDNDAVERLSEVRSLEGERAVLLELNGVARAGGCALRLLLRLLRQLLAPVSWQLPPTRYCDD